VDQRQASDVSPGNGHIRSSIGHRDAERKIHEIPQIRRYLAREIQVPWLGSARLLVRVIDPHVLNSENHLRADPSNEHREERDAHVKELDPVHLVVFAVQHHTNGDDTNRRHERYRNERCVLCQRPSILRQKNARFGRRDRHQPIDQKDISEQQQIDTADYSSLMRQHRSRKKANAAGQDRCQGSSKRSQNPRNVCRGARLLAHRDITISRKNECCSGRIEPTGTTSHQLRNALRQRGWQVEELANEVRLFPPGETAGNIVDVGSVRMTSWRKLTGVSPLVLKLSEKFETPTFAVPNTRTDCLAANELKRRAAASQFSDSGRFLQPLPRFFDPGCVKVADLSHRERLADLRHPFLPTLVTDERDAVDLVAVRRREFNVIPKRVKVPTMEIREVREEPHLAVRRDCRVHGGNELLVVFVVKFAAEGEAKNAARAPIETVYHGISIRHLASRCDGNDHRIIGRPFLFPKDARGEAEMPFDDRYRILGL